MLHLQKLGIRGIRSFDPEDFQEIEFRRLTLILGQNGAGKTTIIESLKFAATGELPPGCDRGKTFVHDIGLTNESTINGQIKLAFNDVEDKKTIITRSVRTTARSVKQKKTVTFKQVDQVIRRDGKSIDQKCCDINSEAVELFGVSRAVLNNVIFCHQEDTNWPLSEGKALKEKFDSIFGSDEYVKSLEKIKKIRTEMVKNLKHASVQTENAREWMKEAKRLEKIYSSENARVQELRARASKYKEELKVHKASLEELSKKEEIIDNHMKDILKIKCSVEAIKHRIQELQSFKLDEAMLSKGHEAISKLVETYHQENEKLIEKKKKLDSELESLMARNGELSRERKTLSQELGKIDELKRQIDIKKNNRNDIFSSNKIFGTEFSKESLLEKQVLTDEEKQFIERSINDQFKEYKDNYDSKMNDLQTKFDAIEGKLRTAQNRKSVLYHQIQEKDKQLKNFQKKLSSLGSVSQDEKESKLQEELNSLSEQIQQYNDELERLNSEAIDLKNNRIKFEKQKKAKMSDIALKESRIATLESKLEANNEAFARKSIDDKIAQKNSIFEKCSSALTNLEPDTKGLLFPSLKTQLDSCEKQMASYRASIEQNTKDKNNALKSMNSYYDLMDQLSEIKSSFVGVCDVEEYEKLKDSKESAMKELYARREYLSTIIPALEKQLDQVKCGGYCPVCENDIDSTWTSKKTGDTMKHSFVIENLTKTIANNKKELQSFSTDSLELEIQRLKKLGPIFDRYQTCKVQLEDHKKTLDSSKAKIEQYKEAISKDNEALNDVKKQLEELEKFRFDVQHHDSICSEIKSLEAQFKTLDSSKFLTELEHTKEELIDLQSLLSFIQSEYERFSTELENNSDRKSSLFKLLKEVEKKERDLKHSQESQSSYRQFVSQINDLESELASLNSEHDQLSKDLPNDVSSSKELKKQIDEQKFKFQNEQLKVRNSLKTFQNICKEIEECNERLKACYEKNSKSYIDTLENNIKDVESKIVDSEKQLKTIKDQLESSSPRLEMMIRCRDLLKCQEEETEYDRRIAEIQAQLPNETLSQIRSSKLSLSEIRSKTQAKLENTNTHVLECQERAESLREQMEEDKFANAEKNYKKLMAEEILTKIGCDDLNKYYKAMDSSITQFHISKMNEINKLLVKLWKIAYQGKDIEAIKIVSDEEVRSADTARRNYDYRVVMIRNGTELDMRGRCSAGQKVLASLVIRLVLAIIFCKKFTVVTLDEPTTNLDRKNIRAFARAITSLMRSNRFFQIIIITHDKEFLECLDSESTGEYFEIIKNENGYSKIQLKSANGETAFPLDSGTKSQATSK